MALTTPCKNICKLDGKWCLGCKRHTDEIGEWFYMSEERAAEIIAELPGRTLPPPGERHR